MIKHNDVPHWVNQVLWLSHIPNVLLLSHLLSPQLVNQPPAVIKLQLAVQLIPIQTHLLTLPSLLYLLSTLLQQSTHLLKRLKQILSRSTVVLILKWLIDILCLQRFYHVRTPRVQR